MSKDLEREYRALVDSEVPDLWARIEAGLEEKTTAPEKTETGLHITDFPVTDSPTVNMRDKKVDFKVWACVAACVCAALIVPAVARTAKMGSSGSNNSAPNYTAQDTTPQATEFHEMAEAAGQEAAACETGEDIAALADENRAANTTVTSDNSNAGADYSADTANAGSAVLEEAVEEEQELNSFRVTVTILDTDVSTDGEILYTAKVIVSENPDMQADSEIEIFHSAAASEGTTMLENAQTYDLTLCEEYSEHSGQKRKYVLNDEVR